jgi:predicted enzyme related to lactoylglutathione lyase
MQLSYTILYVNDVRASVDFYQRAFGLAAGFVDEAGDFATLATGGTALSFCAVSLLEKQGKHAGRPDPQRPCFEIAFTTTDVDGALAQAVAAGAKLIQEPQRMPWGQTVAYVADPEGFWVELCTPAA